MTPAQADATHAAAVAAAIDQGAGWIAVRVTHLPIDARGYDERLDVIPGDGAGLPTLPNYHNLPVGEFRAMITPGAAAMIARYPGAIRDRYNIAITPVDLPAGRVTLVSTPVETNYFFETMFLAARDAP